MTIFWFFQYGSRPPSWICYRHVWTTNEKYLMVFIAFQNLVRRNGNALLLSRTVPGCSMVHECSWTHPLALCQWIQYKVGLLGLKAKHSLLPTYLADSQPKSVGLVWELAATRRSVCIHQMSRVNSRSDRGHEDSTINIVDELLLLIINYYYYLLELLSGFQPARQLRSSSARLFSKPAVASYFSSCAFSAAVSERGILWNLTFGLFPSLPPSKTALFSAAMVHSTVHCQTAPPSRTRPLALYKFVWSGRVTGRVDLRWPVRDRPPV